MTTFQHVKSGKFLTPIFKEWNAKKPERVLNFIGSDSQELYVRNTRKKPDTWPYHQKPLQYVLNSEGYRAPEFDQVDWSNSIVVFGCSNVFGQGVYTEHTLPNQIEQLTGIQTVNIGCAGSAMEFSLINNIILKKHYPKPKAVVNVWPDPYRYMFFKKQNIFNTGYVFKWEDNPDLKFMGILHESHKDHTNLMVRAYIVHTTCELLWDDIPHSSTSFFLDTAEIINSVFLKKTDLARDDEHPGILAHQQAAQIIVSQLGL